jgi:hypothetical protein
MSFLGTYVEGLGKIIKNLNQDCQCVGQDLNQVAPEYKS